MCSKESVISPFLSHSLLGVTFVSLAEFAASSLQLLKRHPKVSEVVILRSYPKKRMAERLSRDDMPRRHPGHLKSKCVILSADR